MYFKLNVTAYSILSICVKISNHFFFNLLYTVLAYEKKKELLNSIQCGGISLLLFCVLYLIFFSTIFCCCSEPIAYLYL
jgi:hypothetical protein